MASSKRGLDSQPGGCQSNRPSQHDESRQSGEGKDASVESDVSRENQPVVHLSQELVGHPSVAPGGADNLNASSSQEPYRGLMAATFGPGELFAVNSQRRRGTGLPGTTSLEHPTWNRVSVSASCSSGSSTQFRSHYSDISIQTSNTGTLNGGDSTSTVATQVPDREDQADGDDEAQVRQDNNGPLMLDPALPTEDGYQYILASTENEGTEVRSVRWWEEQERRRFLRMMGRADLSEGDAEAN